jgi:hypothetical protein
MLPVPDPKAFRATSARGTTLDAGLSLTLDLYNFSSTSSGIEENNSSVKRIWTKRQANADIGTGDARPLSDHTAGAVHRVRFVTLMLCPLFSSRASRHRS